MTIGELINELSKADRNAKVFLEATENQTDRVAISFDDNGDVSFYEHAK